MEHVMGCLLWGWRLNSSKQAFKIFFAENLDSALGDVFQDDAADLNAHEFFDVVTVRLEQAAPHAFCRGAGAPRGGVRGLRRRPVPG